MNYKEHEVVLNIYVFIYNQYLVSHFYTRLVSNSSTVLPINSITQNQVPYKI